jgi:hypothetical protein
MRSQTTCVPSGGPCNVRSLLSCTWSIWQNDLSKTLIDVMWGLAKCVSHQDDLMLFYSLADDLNSEFRSRL